MATASDVCGFCFTEPVFGSCENCNIRLGERCFSNHSKIALFTGHILFPLDNIENKEHLPVHIEKDIHELKCQVHETDHQSLYCGKHDVAICGRCILADHITCTNEIVDLHTTRFDEQKTNAVLGTLKEIETEINDLQVRVEENVRLNDECKASSLDAIREYRKKIDSLLDQLQLAAEQATEEKHKENMNILNEVAQTCKDGSIRVQERGKIVDELSKKKQEKHLFIYSKRLAIEIDGIRTAIKHSNFKNHITQFKFKEHPTLESTLQKEILEIGTLQEACDGSEEIVDDINAKLTSKDMVEVQSSLPQEHTSVLDSVADVSHFERRIQTLEAELKDSKEQRRRALEEIGQLQDRIRDGQVSTKDHHSMLKSELARRDETIQKLQRDVLGLQKERDAAVFEITCHSCGQKMTEVPKKVYCPRCYDPAMIQSYSYSYNLCIWILHA